MRRLTGLLAAVTALFLAVSAQAATITFIHETLDASGTLDGKVFGTSAVRITATGDTSNVQAYSSGLFIDHLTAKIEIAGLGTFDFLTATRTFVNQSNQTVGFSRAGPTGADLLNGPSDGQFAVWDMLSSIGPVNGILSYLQWTNSDVNTSGGVLVFNNASVEGTFTAIVEDQVIPLPAGVWLLLTGLGGIAALRRRA